MSEARVNIPKRIFGYLVDALTISIVTFAVSLLTRSILASAVCNALGFLFRDAATASGSLGKRIARLRLERASPAVPARLTASMLRNLPFALPLPFFGFYSEPDEVGPIVLSLILFLVLSVELWRLHTANGVRYGDLLAGDRVVDLRPQESRMLYVGLAVLVLVLSVGWQKLASLLLPV